MARFQVRVEDPVEFKGFEIGFLMGIRARKLAKNSNVDVREVLERLGRFEDIDTSFKQGFRKGWKDC